MSTPQHFEQLFSYGSLQQEPVQVATFGRTLAGVRDTLPGYQTVRIEIADRTAKAAQGAEFYMDAQKSGDLSASIDGMRFEVTTEELEQADVYEASADYHRVRVRLKSGTEAWLYVSAATAQ